MEALLLFYILAMVLSVIATVLFFEVYHWLKEKSEIKYSLIKGISINLIIGGCLAYWIWSSPSTGEAGAAITLLAPFIVIPFIIAGVLVALIYAWFKRPIFTRKK